MARSNSKSTNSTPFQSSFTHEKVTWDPEENLDLIEEFFNEISQQDRCEYSSKSTAFYVMKLMSAKYRMKDKDGNDVCSMLFHITDEQEEYPWLYFTNKASEQFQPRQKWRALPLAVITGLRDKGVPVFKLAGFEQSTPDLIDGIAEQHYKLG